MGMYLRRPQAQQNYGPVPFVPGGGAVRQVQYAENVGPAMYPPTPAAPRRTSGTAAPVAPFTPAPIVTDPNMTPFRLSLNTQRADEATKAKNFAAAAPLPMSGGTYSGAFGPGPGGQKLAEAARSSFIGHNESVIDQQDLGPGIGVRSFSNKLDADYAQSHPYVSPLDQSKIDSQKAWQDSQRIIAPSIATQNYAGAGAKNAYTDQTRQMTPAKIAETNAKASNLTDTGKAKLKDADTKAAGIAAKGNAFNKDVYNAGVKAAGAGAADIVTPHKMRLQSIFQEQTRLKSEMGRALDGTQRAETQRQIDGLATEETAARKAYHEASEEAGRMRQEATNPDRYSPAKTRSDEVRDSQAGGGEPGASAAPVQGTLVGHDPAARTPEAIAFTANKHGISEDELMKRLGVTA